MSSARLKVLHVEAGRHLYGGALQVVHLVEALAERGVDSVLACPAGSDIAAAAARHCEVLPMRMGGDVDAALTARLMRAMRSHAPDLVHVHSRRGADVWGGLAARITGVPAIISRRVDNPESALQTRLKYAMYERVIGISRKIRDVLAAGGVPEDKLWCVRSAVDATPWLIPVERSAFLAEFGLPDDAVTLGMAAQLIARKGHRHLFAALPRLCAAHPNLRVVLFGRGRLEAELRAEVAAAGLNDRVIFAGFRDDLPRWLGGLDVFVHPAEMEGLGIAVLQASAAALPVVASRAGGLPEAVVDGETGLLVPPGDAAALGEALARLLADGDLRRRMGEAGRAHMLRRFSIDAMADGNLAVYRACIAGIDAAGIDAIVPEHF